MIRASRGIISDLIRLGVRFARRPDGSLDYTREGAHSKPRICFHKDITGERDYDGAVFPCGKAANVTMLEYTVMTDILVADGRCAGMIARTADGEMLHIHARDSVMATEASAAFMNIRRISRF